MPHNTTMAHASVKKYLFKKQKQGLLKDKRSRRAIRTRLNIKRDRSKKRLSVFRSNKYIYAQIIDDAKGVTLLACRGNLKEAGKVGEEIAKKAKERKITSIMFDRGPYRYHGHVKTLAEGVRKGGLKF